MRIYEFNIDCDPVVYPLCEISKSRIEWRKGKRVVVEPVESVDTRIGDCYSDANYYARINGDVYNVGSVEDWSYYDNDGYFWNQNFEESDEVPDLPNEPDDYDEWKQWDKTNRKNKQANNPYWESEECAKDRDDFINWFAENPSETFDSPLDPREYNEDDVDWEYTTDEEEREDK